MLFADGKGSMGYFFNDGKGGFKIRSGWSGWSCRTLPFRVAMEINNIPIGSTNRFVGSSTSFGLANEDNDRCGQSTSNVIRSRLWGNKHRFYRTDGYTTDNSIRHLISYNDRSASYSASRCTYCCWGCGSWHEYVMWGARTME